MGAWIDFRKLRSELKFADVLRHYNVEVTAKGDQHHGFCPLPNHQGKKNSESFSANLAKGIFQCFGCGAKGNLIDFAVLMENLDLNHGPDVRKAALVLQEKFLPAQPARSKAQPAQERRAQSDAGQTELPKTGSQDSKETIVNPPIDFELKNLDATHPYLDKRGFEKDIIATFGLGYCSKGMLTGRIAIPLHNFPDGKLVGYAGRVVDDSLIGKENPKYRFPSGREREGVRHDFQKHLLLYNAHRLNRKLKTLVIVEGFASVWWLTQMGFPNVVAIMGWSMSDEQAAIVDALMSPAGRVWLVSDGDAAGDRCAGEVLPRVSRSRFVKWLKLDEEKQPTDYPGGWYKERLK